MGRFGSKLTVNWACPGSRRRAASFGSGKFRCRGYSGCALKPRPIWLPVNYVLIQSIEKLHRFLGDEFTFAVPCLGGERLTLNGIANLIAERVANIYRRGADGVVPAMQSQPPFRTGPYWRDLLLFYEYFHAETGQGLGASHQTGWTGLIANLVLRHYRKEIPAFWSSQQIREAAE